MSYRKDFLKLSIGKQRVSFMLSDKERQEICKELKKQAKGITHFKIGRRVFGQTKLMNYITF